MTARAYIESSDHKINDGFQPSLQLSSFNSSTFSESSLPMQPLSTELSGAEQRLSITFDEDYSDIGNIDYSNTYKIHDDHLQNIQQQQMSLEKDMRHVRTLLSLEDDRLYYDSVDFTPSDISHFVPSVSGPSGPGPLSLPPLSPTPDIGVVVKGLPGAGPRLTGAKTTFSPPLYHHDYRGFNNWAPDHTVCDDTVKTT